MEQKGLTGFFEEFLEKESLFLEKRALQSSYSPETINHRDKEIKQIANILAPTLRLEKTSNIFVYGGAGSGKTLVVKHTTKILQELAKARGLPVDVIYLNCKLKKVADTEYRLVAQLAREFGKEIPPTGLPTEEIYNSFFEVIDKEKRMVVVVLDEIDQLVKKAGDSILYNITRINEELKNSQISIIGISNDMMFLDNIDPRVKSSLSEESTAFKPYNALQIQDILRQRADAAFSKGVLEPGVIEKCAAYSAREHGDIRRALDLLRVAAEIAEREDRLKVSLEHLDEAEEKIEKERVVDVIDCQTKQAQAVFYAILAVHQRRDDISTGGVYNLYKGVCSQIGLRPLTQRRVSDIITELDMVGVINIRVISKGRYGRTREISLVIPPAAVPKARKMLEEELELP